MIEQMVAEIFPGLSPGEQDAAHALARSVFWDAIYERCPKARTEIVNKLRAGRQIVWVSIEGALVSTKGGGLDIYRYARQHQFKRDLRFKDAVYVWGSAGLSSIQNHEGNLTLDRMLAEEFWKAYAN